MLLLPDIETDKEYLDMVLDILVHDEFLKLHQMTHHYVTTRYNHCLFVSYMSYLVGKKMHLDTRALARAGLLHDFFLESREDIVQLGQGSHNAVHPRIALKNAEKYFELNDLEKDIILKHMFLCTPVSGMPKYRESWLVSAIDKYCAIYECSGSVHMNMTEHIEAFKAWWEQKKAVFSYK